MSSYSMTPENLLRTLPDVLKNDAAMMAIATGIAAQLAQIAQETQWAGIYQRLDTLPEEFLDTLARDFKVDWWSYDYTPEEKRKTLRDSWYVRRHLGTKKAVERAISAVYPGAEVVEWFQYGGRPFHFKLMIPVDQTMLDPKKHATVLALVGTYQNLRSVMEKLEYYGSGGMATTYVAAACVGCECIDGAIARYY